MCETGAAQLTKCPSLRAKGEDGSDGRRVGGMEGWRGCSAAETSHAGLPVWLRNEGKGHRHTHSRTRTDTHSGPSMAPRLISGAQRPQTEVAEGAQWEQGLKAWFTSALRTGERERERAGVRGGLEEEAWVQTTPQATEAEKSFIFVMMKTSYFSSDRT